MKENKPNNNNTPLSGKLDQITATNLLEDLQNPDIKIKKCISKFTRYIISIRS